MDSTSPRFSPPAPTPGDRIPDLLLPNRDGTLVSLYDNVSGGPVALIFAEDTKGLAECLSGDDCLQAFIVTPGNPADGRSANTYSGDSAQLLFDPDGRASRTLGVSWESMDRRETRVYLLDPNQRLLKQFDGAADSALKACFDHARSLSLFGEAYCPRHLAPVLMIPRVFGKKFCRTLIDVFHDRGHEESGVYSLEQGELRHRVDHSMKKRFDHYVRDQDTTHEISRRMARRVLPEIEKAFCYRVTRLEEFKIACYRASEKGYFRAHRDNFSPQTVHRRFALTLNLNAEEYEGGELRFPEYGPHVYKPVTGEAIVFSCSLLHEAMDVTRGERYVLLAFLYGEDGVLQKEEMARRMGGPAGGRN